MYMILVADKNNVEKVYKIKLLDTITKKYKAIILAVSHTQFSNLNFLSISEKINVIFVIKSFLDRSMVDARL